MINMANITDWAFDVMQAGKGACRLRDIGIGRLFEVGGVEFIKCDEQGNTVPAIAKNVWKKSIFSRRSNDFRESEILADLRDNFLPIIINQVGIEGVTEFVTHLKSLDGLNQYGDIRSLVSIPDLEFYREYAEIIEPYRVDKWWWLANPWSIKPHYDPYYVCLVTPSGRVGNDDCVCSNGVRPRLNFLSSIFVAPID